ncbi:MAG: NADPH-dependent F420 reductase [Actinomycetia bacterium]|nr:NADPH-dependent F420 reductase [Actinomycetes bacterium]
MAEDSAVTIPDEPKVGVLGGTGDQGKGLALRLAMAGIPVGIGSRDQSRAEDAATETGYGCIGRDNATIARWCDIAIVAVPWAGHEALVASLADPLAEKVVIDCVNPLGFDKRGAFPLPVPEGSAAEQAQALLPDSVVVGAFHNVSAVLLLDRDLTEVETDVLVLGDVRAATDAVQRLVSLVPGMRGVFGGRLRNSAQIEALTANLISINRRYKIHAGIKITDLPE